MGNDKSEPLPPELEILEQELDAVSQGFDAIDEHITKFLEAIASLRHYPLDQWVRWGLFDPSPPMRIRRLGKRMQRLAGNFLALGSTVTRFADMWQRESESTSSKRER